MRARTAAAGPRAHSRAPLRAGRTVGETLREAQQRLAAAGIENTHLEAEVLLRHALGLSREALLARLREPAPEDARSSFESLLQRRLAHEPTAYVTGRKEFFGLDLECTPAALIPRPETELIVELALDWVEGRGSRVERVRMVDVGSGSGAIAVALAVHARIVRVLAIDTSRGALELARRNARKHGVEERIDLVQGDLLPAVRVRFDVIVANLPYVPLALRETLAPEIRVYEPDGALYVEGGGTALIEALLVQARDALAQGGVLLAEHAWDQGERVRDAARASFPDARIETRRDLAGRERVLVVKKSVCEVGKLRV